MPPRRGHRRRCRTPPPAVEPDAPDGGPLQDHPSPASRCPSAPRPPPVPARVRSEEHTSELQSLMRISYAVFCLKKKIKLLAVHLNTQLLQNEIFALQ